STSAHGTRRGLPIQWGNENQNYDFAKCSSSYCLRLARSVKKKASRNPSTAPIIASQIVWLSNDRLPLPAIRKPQYAIAKVQGIMRRMLMGPPLGTEMPTYSFLKAEG